ncbi:MAG: hypothetical protein BM556_10730 [Bacteriovorax sp. MedPE-SWde]|nr:MAG: hypothetical protein BM556_10730 [Bacteriovorax sp. MedPE-SWde]
MGLKLLLAISLFLMSYMSFAFDHTHVTWNRILDNHLSFKGPQSLFNYKKLKANQRDFYNYLSEISAVSKEEFDKFSQDQQLAFLINAYNAFTVKLIVDNYPLKSIKDLGGLFKSPWKKKFFKLFGKKAHLDRLEHKMIREWYSEPRIHFAVVCASLGCPPLAKKAFTAKNLETLLEEQSLSFINDKTKNSISNGKLRISKIFKWYGDDFEGVYGSYLDFIAERITKDRSIQKKISNGEISTSWNDYDWNLNE